MTNPAGGTIVFHGATLKALLNDPAGPVGVDLARRANRVRTEAIRRAPVDTGRLRGSIRYAILHDSGGLAAVIGSDVSYAIYVHGGTRPHFPPPGALTKWAGRHGFVSPYPICFAIAARGTKARPFLTEALNAAGP